MLQSQQVNYAVIVLFSLVLPISFDSSSSSSYIVLDMNMEFDTEWEANHMHNPFGKSITLYGSSTASSSSA